MFYIISISRVWETVSCFTIKQRKKNITNSCPEDTTSRKEEGTKYVNELLCIKVHTATRWTIRHSLKLHWFADLMNVTEEVTIHRPNVSTLLFSAFIRGDLQQEVLLYDH